MSELIGAVAEAYSADRSEFDSGILAIHEILQMATRSPRLSYYGYVACRHSEDPEANEEYRAATHVLGAMLERQSDYAAGDGPPPSAARAALGGVEAVIRRELAAGKAARLPELLPSFVYACTVPYVGQTEALRLAQRGRELSARQRIGAPPKSTR